MGSGGPAAYRDEAATGSDQLTARSRPSQYGARRFFLRILPVGLRGSGPVMSTDLGHLKWARRSRQWAISSSSVAEAPSLSETTALTDSPQVSSGTPMIAT